MPNEEGIQLEDTRKLIVGVENELARLALIQKTPEVQQAVKMCVYHIILRAIALSKDPKADVSESKRLFELAQEIIAQSELDQENDVQNRLTDLINAMVDQDDLSIQFRYYRMQNVEYFKTVFEMVRNEGALKTEEYESLNTVLLQMRQTLNRLAKRKSVFRVILISLTSLAILLFTVVSSIVIILALLSANNSSSPYEKSSMEKFPMNQKANE